MAVILFGSPRPAFEVTLTAWWDAEFATAITVLYLGRSAPTYQDREKFSRRRVHRMARARSVLYKRLKRPEIYLVPVATAASRRGGAGDR